MSDTPETDAEELDGEALGWTVYSSFSRRLERERDEARRERDEARRERDQAREIARLAFYIIRGVDPKFVKLAYERSVYWRGNDQPIYFMQVEIKKWDKAQKEKA